MHKILKIKTDLEVSSVIDVLVAVPFGTLFKYF